MERKRYVIIGLVGMLFLSAATDICAGGKKKSKKAVSQQRTSETSKGFYDLCRGAWSGVKKVILNAQTYTNLISIAVLSKVTKNLPTMTDKIGTSLSAISCIPSGITIIKDVYARNVTSTTLEAAQQVFPAISTLALIGTIAKDLYDHNVHSLSERATSFVAKNALEQLVHDMV
jgi:hypothetical protein